MKMEIPLRVIILVVVAIVGSASADSVFVPLQPPKLVVCQKVCPVCAWCWPVSSEDRWYCVNRSSAIGYFILPKSDSCDSIVWGRWREICRVDTTMILDTIELIYQLDLKGDSLVRAIKECRRVIGPIDTVYTDDPRCKKKVVK